MPLNKNYVIDCRLLMTASYSLRSLLPYGLAVLIRLLCLHGLTIPQTKNNEILFHICHSNKLGDSIVDICKTRNLMVEIKVKLFINQLFADLMVAVVLPIDFIICSETTTSSK